MREAPSCSSLTVLSGTTLVGGLPSHDELSLASHQTLCGEGGREGSVTSTGNQSAPPHLPPCLGLRGQVAHRQ